MVEPSGIGRRGLLGMGLAVGVTPALATIADDPNEVVRLWPGPPPGAPAVLPIEQITDRTPQSGFLDRFVTGTAHPMMTVFRPARPNGAAMLVAPGGGYIRVVIDKEGYEVGRRLAAAGITTFVLRYRLPGDGWTPKADAPLQDAQRAMRLIRAHAADYGVDPGRIGVLGFSAGGHLAGSLATGFDRKVYAPMDAADQVSAGPDFLGLGYAVVDLSPPLWHRGSSEALLGLGATPEMMAAYSPERQVSAGAPPGFIFHAADDPDVPVGNSLAWFAALRAAGVPAELHVFEEGGHGFGIWLARGKPASAWPDLLLAWAERHGFLG